MHLIYSRLTAKGEEVKGKKQKTPDARAREKMRRFALSFATPGVEF